MTIDEYLSRPNKPDEDYLIDGVMPAGGKAMIYGQPKAGKTYVALSLALAVANPAVKEWFSWPVLNHGPALYLSLDSAPGEWEGIYLTAAKRTPLYAPGIPFYHVDDSMPPTPFDIEDARTRAREWVVEAVHWTTERAGEALALVVVDVFRNLYWGKENESEVQMRVLSILSACAPKTAILIAHHGKKSPLEGDYDLMSGGRGSNYLPGNSSTIFRVTSRPDGLRGKLEYAGRGCGNGNIRLLRPAPFNREDKGSPNNFWQLDNTMDTTVLQGILNEMHGQPIAVMGAELAKRLGTISAEAGRARVARALGVKD